MLNMFRMLIHPSSGACDLFVELFHGLYCSRSMRVVTLWFGWGGVVSGCGMKHYFSLASLYSTIKRMHVPINIRSVLGIFGRLYKTLIEAFTSTLSLAISISNRTSGRGRDSSVVIALAMGLMGRGSNPGGGRDFPHLSRPVQGPTHPPIQWVPGFSRR